MSKGRIVALFIVAMVMVILLFNAKGDVNINLIFETYSPLKCMAFLSFTGIGVIVGILLK